MKNVILTLLLLTGLSSCSKVEEIVSESVSSAKEKAQEKAKETFQETVNTQFDKLVNAENIQLEHVFPRENNLGIEHAVGKKMTLPNGTLIYVFKYKTAEKDLLLENLVKQSTTDETRSDVDFQKVDGAMIIEKVTFFQKSSEQYF